MRAIDILVSGALLAGGCGVENVGSTSTTEAITVNTTLASFGAAQAAQWGVGCKLRDTTHNVDYYSQFGGYDALGTTPTNKIELLKAGAGNSWVTQTATLGVARGDLRAIALSDDVCAVVGGASSQGGTTSAKVELFKLTPGNPATLALHGSITPADLNVARDRFALSTCVSNSKTHLVVITGRTSGTSATPSIEVSDDVAATTWASWTKYDGSSTPSISFSPAVFDFGFARNGATANQYLIAGGNPSGGSRTDAINLVSFDSSCVPTVNAAKDSSNVAVKLSAAVDGNLAALDSTDHFAVSAGRTAAHTLWNSGDLITVSNWSTGVVSKTSPASATIAVGAYRPVVAQNGTKTAIFGGSDVGTPTTHALNNAQQYNGGFTDGAATLANVSFGPTVFLDAANSKFFAGSGLDIAGGTLDTDAALFTVP